VGLIARSQWRFLWRHPLLALLTLLGVALGIAVIHATDRVNRSIDASIEDASAQLRGAASARLVGSGPTLAEADYAGLRRSWLARHPDWRLLPVVSGSVQVDGERWQLLGIDPVADPRLRQRQRQLRGGNRDGAAGHLIAADTVLVSDRAARTGNLLLQPRRAGARAFELRIAGHFRDPDGLLALTLVVDIGTAQRLLGLAGQLSHIELIGDARAAATLPLPAGLQLIPETARGEAQQQLLRAFQFNLSAFSLLALLVGLLLMASAVQFGFWQRAALLSRLHLLGAPPARLLRLLLLEAVLIAALACLLGWALGALLSRLLLPAAAATVNDLFHAQGITAGGGAAADYMKSAALALLATLAANGWLYRRWRRGEGRVSRSRWPLIGALLLAGIALLQLPGLVAAFAALFALACGWLLLVPVLYRTALAWLGRLPLPPLSAMALRDGARHSRRLAFPLVALCVALAAGLGLQQMVGSFRQALTGWLDQQLAADLYVSGQPALMAALEMELGADHGALLSARHHALQLGPLPVTLMALALPQPARAQWPLLTPADGAWEQFDAGALLVGEPLARRLGLASGDRLSLPTPSGPRDFPVAAIVRDYSTDYGRVQLAAPVYARHWGERPPDSLGLFLQPGAEGEALRSALAQRGARVAAGAELRSGVGRLFERTFAVTRILYACIVSCALAALVSTLLIHQLMQRRQLATLRALGLGRGGLLQLLLGQAALLGLAAGLLALPLGGALAWLLVAEVNPRAFGWSMPLHWDAGGIAMTVAAAPLLALLGALWPAWRSWHLQPARELSRE
jgi:putative ABC transport system permease protein